MEALSFTPSKPAFNLLPVLRNTLLYKGQEVPAVVSKSKISGCTIKEYQFDRLPGSQNGSKSVSVLKEDNEGNCIWWTTGGINWCWFGAINLEEAIKLHKEVTGSKEPATAETFVIDEFGAAEFRLHR